MPDHPFCFKLQDAAAHAKYAHELTADLITMPDYPLLETKHRRLLLSTRNNLRRAEHVLIALYPHALDVVYVQAELPSLEPADGDGHLQEATSPSPQNVQPPGPTPAGSPPS